ncbi:MAG: ribose 5-phosphate isomerase B [Chloroflexi bacterium]|nr:ribose 5-phosphate isomerase B [Chloroflexota bacterium]
MIRNVPVGSVYEVTAVSLITPLAREVALERQIKLVQDKQTNTTSQPSSTFTSNQNNHRVIAIGADHGGYQLKEQLKKMLESADFGYTLIDCGTHSTESVDYPDLAYAVASAVSNENAWRGIIIDGAGIGSCMTANKVPGVRAAMCYDQSTAVNSREHNNANVLTLGAGLIGTNLAKQIVTVWLSTQFGGGRHARRVDKIDQLDQRFQR